MIAADSVVAYGFSSAFTENFLRSINERLRARVVFSDVRVHPLFLSVSAKNIEVSDLDSPSFKVLAGESASARVDLFSLLFRRKVFLSSLRFKKFHLKAIQDTQGVLNLEKIFEPEAGRGFRNYFHGWKHQDWFFNAYARLKFAARRAPPEHRRDRPVFKIGSIAFEDGFLVLTDRTARAVVFNGIDLKIKDLRWYRTGEIRMAEVSARGNLAAPRPGRFELQVKRDRRQVLAFLSVKTLDLMLFKPLYVKTSPVYFERGFITWTSSARMTSDRLWSSHRVKFEDHRLRSTTAWSPESEAVLSALNRHPSFELRFKIIEDQGRILFEGMEESVAAVLKKDFNPKTIRSIQARTSEELQTLAERFQKA